MRNFLTLCDELEYSVTFKNIFFRYRTPALAPVIKSETINEAYRLLHITPVIANFKD